MSGRNPQITGMIRKVLQSNMSNKQLKAKLALIRKQKEQSLKQLSDVRTVQKKATKELNKLKSGTIGPI